MSNPTSGGGCTKDADGNLVLIKDQDESYTITSIINSKDQKVPVGIIIGQSCSCCTAVFGRSSSLQETVMFFWGESFLTDIMYWHIFVSLISGLKE